MVTLAEKINQETEKLNKLMEKRTELDRKIKKTQERLEKYKLIQNNQKFTALEEATVGAGVSVEDILAALRGGDLIALQERMESLQAKKIADEEELDDEDITEETVEQ